jgi:FkbM family methyltransferase
MKSPPKKVVDVGGNLGLFTLFLKSQFPNALVHAYEPNPECRGYFAKNTSALDQVVLYPEGLASETGTADLLCDEESTRLTRTQIRQDEAGEVSLASLETAMDRIGGNVDLLKIDCEGAEWDILRARCALREAAHIRMEYHLWVGKELSDLHKMAASIGFEITFLAPSDQIGFVYMERR